MSKAVNIHDKFVKAILADKDVAADYFKSCLPVSVSDGLDFGTLTRLPGSYLSKELKETMSDIVYSCKSNYDGKEIKVSLLIEHKSYRDRNTPIQIGSYIFSALQSQIDNKEELSVVIPVLFYHGNEVWKYTTLSDLFEALPSEWRHFVPNFDYVYNDLSSMSDESLSDLSNQFLAACLLTLKHYMEGNWLDEHAVQIFNRAGVAPGNLLGQFAVYFLRNSKSDKTRIIEITELVPESIKDKIMSTLDLFKEMGLEEGREIGLSLGRLEGRQQGLKEGRQKGLHEGRQKGLDEGRRKGLNEGRQEGLKEGRQEGLKEGRQEGLNEGRQEGVRKTRVEIVSNLIKDSSLTDEQIASAANVSIDLVADIRAGRTVE